MEIIDTHAHVGPCNVFDLEITQDELLAGMDEHGVKTSVVQPFPGAPDPEGVHDQIAALGKAHPGRFYGVASINPHFGDRSFNEMRRCVKDLGFVGIKMHTIGHAIIPPTKVGMKLAELAIELNVPLLIHTGPGAPIAQPIMCLPLARKFPELTIILCHAGFTCEEGVASMTKNDGYAFFAGEATIVASEAKNIILEPSWCTSLDLKGMAAAIGTDRIQMGTDGVINIGTELAKGRTIGFEENQLEEYFCGTAKRVFGID